MLLYLLLFCSYFILFSASCLMLSYTLQKRRVVMQIVWPSETWFMFLSRLFLQVTRVTEASETECLVVDYNKDGLPSGYSTQCVTEGTACPCGKNTVSCPDPNDATERALEPSVEDAISLLGGGVDTVDWWIIDSCRSRICQVQSIS